METVLKWCALPGFPKEWQEELAAQRFEKDKEPETPMETLLYVLYGCEETAARNAAAGSPEEILMDSLGDILIWTKNYYNEFGVLGFAQRAWMERFFALNIFRIGRLEFAFGKARRSHPPVGLSEGNPIIEVHIPQNGPLEYDACRASIRAAAAFFEKHYPDYRYTHFTCGTWFLGPEMKQFLPPESNIVKYQSLFDLFFFPNASEDALRRIFVLNDKQGKESTLQKKVRAFLDAGGTLHSGFGVVKAEVFL